MHKTRRKQKNMQTGDPCFYPKSVCNMIPSWLLWWSKTISSNAVYLYNTLAWRRQRNGTIVKFSSKGYSPFFGELKVFGESSKFGEYPASVRLCVDNNQKKLDSKEKCKQNKKQDFYNIEIHIFFDNVFESKASLFTEYELILRKMWIVRKKEQSSGKEYKQLNKWVCSFCEILRSLLHLYELDESDLNFEVLSVWCWPRCHFVSFCFILC